MTYEHYTGKPFLLDMTKTYVQSDHPTDKPRGMWISVKGSDDWESWCISEQWGSIAYVAEVVLKSDANILILDTVEKVYEFNDKYKEDPGWGSSISNMDYINWVRVAADYDGIIIAPYQWSIRNHFSKCFWYYGWDVASGCIWNLEAIESVSESVKNPNNERQFQDVE